MNLPQVKSVLPVMGVGNNASVFMSTHGLFHPTFSSCPVAEGEEESSRVGLEASHGLFSSAPIMAIRSARSVCHLQVFFLLSLCAIRSSLFLLLLFPSEDRGQ